MNEYGGITLSELYERGYDRDGNIEITDYTITSVNRETGVSIDALKSYASSTDALQKAHPYKMSLNGDWKLNYVYRPEEKPADFFRIDYDVSGWDTIPVPANVELHGYGVPQYENVTTAMSIYNKGFSQENYETLAATMQMPTQYNPVASYVRTFSIPDDWQGRRNYLVFDGAETCVYAWLNGIFIGYSTDSFTQKIFDITEYLTEGENRLAVRTYTFSNGAWAEDQDYITFCGLSREVAIYSKPQTQIHDFDVVTTFDKEYTDATLTVKVAVDGALDENMMVKGELYDTNTRIQEFTVMDGVASVLVKQPKQWSAETPYLYRLVLLLCDMEGQVFEALGTNVGFRQVEIHGTRMTINGKKLMLKGVNRHENSLLHGRAVTREEMIQDIRIIKQFNFNAVRTCHYPDAQEWYDLCDEYGLYILDETNLETHGWSRYYPTSHQDWLPICLDRMSSMYERDKNHSCVVIWSLGNEAGKGSVFGSMLDWMHEKDPSHRPVHYEGDHEHSDMYSTMYSSVYRLEQQGLTITDQPVMMCEYSHAMGNSLGNHKEYWDVFEKYDNMHGGFIWDFAEQSVLWCDEHGPVAKGCCNENCHPYHSYGGDWETYATAKLGIPNYYEEVGAAANSENFCCNGVFQADRTPKPGAYEVRQVQQNINILETNVNLGDFVIQNKFAFQDLSDYELNYRIEENGKEIYRNSLDVNVAAGTNRTIHIDYPQIEPKPGCHYDITFWYVLREDTSWAEAGYVAGWNQYEIKELYTLSDRKQEIPSIIYEEQDGEVIIRNDDVLVSFEKRSGNMKCYRYQERDILTESEHTSLLEPDYSRMYSDNDYGNRMFLRCTEWNLAGENRQLQEMTVNQKKQSCVAVRVVYQLPNLAVVTLEYQVYGNGAIQIQHQLDTTKTMSQCEIPQIGTRLTLDSQYENVTWFGNGPFENYIDRANASVRGIYHSSVDELFFPYVRPQLTGNRTNISYVALTNRDGYGLLVTAGTEQLEFTALSYTSKEVNTAAIHEGSAKDKACGIRHGHDLPDSHHIYLNLNQVQCGVGGSDSWGSLALPPYLVTGRNLYAYSYTLYPVTKESNFENLSGSPMEI
ncbi:MAG: glycoside hydrolase family 2 TIM barrel-domain containing protein [Lachnospiraceae bacterium]